MRTTVYTDPNDLTETDEWPGCYACVYESGALEVLENGAAIADYEPGQWSSVEVTRS